MSATDEILRVLKNEFRRESDPTTKAVDLLAQHEAEALAAAGPVGHLRDYTVVWTASDGSDIPATELRCILCGGLVQGVGPHTLLALTALANPHNCQNNRKDGRQ